MNEGEMMNETINPKCPYCTLDLVLCEKSMVSGSGLIINVIWCNSCKTTLNTTVIGQQQQPAITDLSSANGRKILIR